MDGALEGEICGLVIQNSSPICINVGVTLCSIWQANNASGGIAVGEGDSGGPVFRFIGSGLYATGTVTAGGGTQSNCPAWQVQPDRLCFSQLFYTDINTTLSHFGLSLST